MKPVAIVMAQSNRTELTQQALDSLAVNTGREYKLFTKNGMDKGEMRTVNDLVLSIDYDWEYLVRADDDLYFNIGWLDYMLCELIENEDVWLLGGCRYPTHNILENREGINIMDICPGNHWLLRRKTWDRFGTFYEDKTEVAEDVRFCQAIQKAGGKVACLQDQTIVVHCGIKNIKGRGRTPYVEGYMQGLADTVGAITNGHSVV